VTRSCQPRHPIIACVAMLMAGFLSGCGMGAPGFGDGAHQAANKSAAPTYQEAKLSSELSAKAGVRSERKSTVAHEAIKATSSSKAERASRAAQSAGGLDPSQTSERNAGAGPDTATDTGATPSGAKPVPAIDSSVTSPSMTTPVVGSPEWKRQKQESEKQEQRIQRVIEGICHGC